MPNLTSSTRLVALLLWTPLGAACQRDFGHALTRLDSADLIIGSTNEQDIVRREGSPWQWYVAYEKPAPASKSSPFSNAQVRGVWSVMHYYYLMRPTMGTDTTLGENFWFFNHKLSGWLYASDAAATNSDFDVARARSIRAGMSQNQVRALLGPPTGRAAYPLIADPHETLWGWSYTHVTGGHRLANSFNAVFGPDRRVVASQVETFENN